MAWDGIEELPGQAREEAIKICLGIMAEECEFDALVKIHDHLTALISGGCGFPILSRKTLMIYSETQHFVMGPALTTSP
jgi:hypothetical protein